MSDKTEQKPRGGEAERQARQRNTRLAERLRVNLQRRKAQSRARRAGAEDQRPDGLLPDDTVGSD